MNEYALSSLLPSSRYDGQAKWSDTFVFGECLLLTIFIPHGCVPLHLRKDWASLLPFGTCCPRFNASCSGENHSRWVIFMMAFSGRSSSFTVNWPVPFVPKTLDLNLRQQAINLSSFSWDENFLNKSLLFFVEINTVNGFISDVSISIVFFVPANHRLLAKRARATTSLLSSSLLLWCLLISSPLICLQTEHEAIRHFGWSLEFLSRDLRRMFCEDLTTKLSNLAQSSSHSKDKYFEFFARMLLPLFRRVLREALRWVWASVAKSFLTALLYSSSISSENLSHLSSFFIRRRDKLNTLSRIRLRIR